MIKTLEEQLIERRADLARLELIAPVDGTVLPPPTSRDQPESPGQLKSWSGSPFAKKNIGATLPESTLFCEIGDPHQMEADMIIEQDDMEFVARGPGRRHQARCFCPIAHSTARSSKSPRST